MHVISAYLVLAILCLQELLNIQTDKDKNLENTKNIINLVFNLAAGSLFLLKETEKMHQCSHLAGMFGAVLVCAGPAIDVIM